MQAQGRHFLVQSYTNFRIRQNILPHRMKNICRKEVILHYKPF